MQRFARIVDGVVAEPPFEAEDADDLARLFHPDIAAACIPCGPEVADGWIFTGGSFVMPVAAEISKERLLGYARACRFAMEVSGTTLGDMPLRTDRETRSALSEAAAMIADDPAWSTRWELPNGAWVTIDAALLPQVVRAVGNWRAAAFALQEVVASKIEAGTIKTFAEIDAAFASG